MANEIIKRDQNFVTVLAGITDDASEEIRMFRIDPATGRLLVSATGGAGTGTVTDVSVVSANGFAGSVANSTTTPAITLETTITGILQGDGTAISAIVIGSGLTFIGGTLSATGGTLDLEVNGTPNVDQTLLNLVAGTNVTITDNGDGSVTIAASGGSGDVESVTGNIVDNTDPANPVVDQVQADWNEADSGEPSFILNKPSIPSVTPAALTRVDDTNVTLILGGTPATSLLQAVSLTLGWSGQLSMARGGTGANLADPGADRILFWDDSAGAMTWLTVGTGLTITDTTISASAASGDVVGPASATDNAAARFDSTTGKLIQDSSLIIGDLTSNEVYVTLPSKAGVGSNLILRGGPSSDDDGGQLLIIGGTGTGANPGGLAAVVGGVAGATGIGGDAALFAGAGGATSGTGGAAHVTAGNGTAGNGSGGDVNIRSGSAHGSGTNGKVTIGVSGLGKVSYDYERVVNNQTMIIPDRSGWAGILAPLVNMSTIFEDTARFTSIASGGTNTFGTSGLALTTTGTANRKAGVTARTAAGDIFSGTSVMTTCINITTVGTAGFIFVGVGQVTDVTENVNPHYGFKIEGSAGPTFTLYGSQAQGGTEAKTAALTTVSAGQTLWLSAIKDSNNISVTYYWRLNGGDWSAGDKLTSNVPTTATDYWMCVFAGNGNNSTTLACSVLSYSLQR